MIKIYKNVYKIYKIYKQKQTLSFATGCKLTKMHPRWPSYRTRRPPEASKMGQDDLQKAPK